MAWSLGSWLTKAGMGSSSRLVLWSRHHDVWTFHRGAFHCAGQKDTNPRRQTNERPHLIYHHRLRPYVNRITVNTGWMLLPFVSALMSFVGQSRRFGQTPITSALPRLADIVRAGRHVSKAPKADLSLIWLDAQLRPSMTQICRLFAIMRCWQPCAHQLQ
jgi:hypothetical protein